jgi:hypothetical protein
MLRQYNTISGTANGANAVVERARKITSYGLNFELLHTLVSQDNVALSLHNTAPGYGMSAQGQQDRRERDLCDVDGMNAFFI